MNISLKWLKEYVDFDLSAEETAAALTSIGLEVEGLEEVPAIRGGLKGLVTAEVLSCEPHPDSDHMHVCRVNIGQDEPVQIVCGAPNVATGQKVIVATIGTKLYDGDQEFTIKKSKLRGVESFGMICAEDEIGIGTDHNGIIVLPADTAAGIPAATYYNLESDYLLEIGITPNRADACSHYGVARDLYAWLVRQGVQTQLKRPDVSAFKVDNHDLPIDIEIEASEACPRYCGVTLTGCRVAESPKWLQERLTAIGLRPINNIVDITNYVMLAFGQPLHCFDADMVKGRKVIVKTLPEGTPFVTLDGIEHKLSNHDLAICNAEEPMCIAGVFGGKGSGTYENTTNILFESAYFNPTWIRKSARRHGLNTDASFRFERGIDPDGQVYAIKVAALLAQELAGGKVSMEICDVKAKEIPQSFSIELSLQYLRDLAGASIPLDTVKKILRALEIRIEQENEQSLRLRVPAYRVDVQRPCDIVEEILRIYGYNNIAIPSQITSCQTIENEVDRSQKLQKRIADQLVGQGFNEILNNSLTKSAYYADLQALPANRLVMLLNPLSQDLNAMRQSLLFGGLESLARNVNRKATDLRFFEFGNCYSFDASKRQATAPEAQSGERQEETHHMTAYDEKLHLGLWLTGNRISNSWAHANQPATVFELKAYAYDVLMRLGIDLQTLQTAHSTNDIFSHGLSVSDRNGKLLLEFGIVTKKLTAPFGLENDVFYTDFCWNALMQATRKHKVEFSELSKYPAVFRDLALLVDKSVEFAQIEQIVLRADKRIVKSVKLFDVYEGKNLEAGKKSYAINIVLQDDTHTMNEKQVEAVMKKIVSSLTHQLSAQLR